jgi:hypothetical protein
MQGSHASPSLLPVKPFALPAAHDVHATLPEDDAYLPTAQLLHDAAMAPLNEPGRHATHCEEPTGANSPATHGRHAETLVLPSTAFAVPAAHGVHVAVPFESAYVPTGQAVQVALFPSLPVPTSHCEHAEAPAPLNEPASQGTHAATDTLPAAEFFLPAAQSTHVALPELE